MRWTTVDTDMQTETDDPIETDLQVTTSARRTCSLIGEPTDDAVDFDAGSACEHSPAHHLRKRHQRHHPEIGLALIEPARTGHTANPSDTSDPSDPA